MADNFDVDSLAKYLHLSPAQVTKMADRGKIPGRKVGGSWVFSHAEIHHWLEERMGVWDEEELARLEGALKKASTAEGEVTVAELLPLQAIAIPLAARTKSSIISSMVELAADTGMLWDPVKMIDAVRQREDMFSTALDSGVALLHPRRPLPNILSQPLLALGRTSSGVPFASGKAGLTDVFFLICSVDDRQHLQSLARLSRLIGTPGFLDQLREAADAVAAHALIGEFEEQLSG